MAGAPTERMTAVFGPPEYRGVRVVDSVVLGARSSVFRDVPSDVVMVGSPAQPIRDAE